MPHCLRLAAICILLLIACAEETRTEPAAMEATTDALPSQPTVRSSITLGRFDGTVHDLALFEAPALGFRGQVIAANDAAGIAVIGVDGSNAKSWMPEVIAHRVEVTYAINPDAGSVLTLSQDGTLAAYTLDGALLTSLDVPGGLADDVCAAGDSAAVLVNGDIQMVEVGTDQNGAAYLSLGPVVETGGIDGCDATSVGILFAGDEAQLIVDPEGQLRPTGQQRAAMPVISVEGTALGVTSINGMLQVADTALLMETADGEPILPVLVEATGGNYGGVLRDGVVAVLDDQNTLHLLPWSGAASASGLKPTSDSKRPKEAVSPDRIDLPSPSGDSADFTPQLQSPGFEDIDLPQPNGRR